MTYKIEKGPQDARHHLILAHGAGAGIETPFMTEICNLLEARDFRLTLFEFAYMATRRSGGSRRPPPKTDVLIKEYAEILETVSSRRPANQTLIIGGKSLGGRVASLFADDSFTAKKISGLVCLGYPFHPPGHPDKLRTAHLEKLHCPALVVQGDRDPFGNRADVYIYKLANTIRVHWLGDGDHDFGPRGASGFTRKGNLAAAADAVSAFAATLKPVSD